jgi:hypothetical protein
MKILIAKDKIRFSLSPNDVKIPNLPEKKMISKLSTVRIKSLRSMPIQLTKDLFFEHKKWDFF